MVTPVQGSRKRGFWRVTFCLPCEKVIQQTMELPVAGLPRMQQPSLLPLLKIKTMTHSLCPRCCSRGPPRTVQHLLSSCWSFQSFAGLRSSLDAALIPSADKHPMNCLLVWSPRMLHPNQGEISVPKSRRIGFFHPWVRQELRSISLDMMRWIQLIH